MSKPHILIKLPSRGRPEKLFRALDSIHNHISDQKYFTVSCTLDTDDAAVCNEDVVGRISEYPNTEIAWGTSESKIHAINRSMPEEFGIVCIGSDDIFFNAFGFDEMIRLEMRTHFPDGDGYLHFREKDSLSALNVMTVIDKKYYDRFGYIYHPEYLSLFADNHQMDVAKILGRYVYIDYSIMEHRNPAYNEYNEVKDEMFRYQQEIGWSIDQLKYEEMKSRNYDLHLIQNT